MTLHEMQNTDPYEFPARRSSFFFASVLFHIICQLKFHIYMIHSFRRRDARALLQFHVWLMIMAGGSPHATYATSLARLMAQITHAMNVARLTSSHISKPSYLFFTPLLHILYSNFGFLPSMQHIFVSKF